jgi:small conductance mechanosensitive channel
MISNTSGTLQYSGQSSPNTDTKSITKINTINGYTPINKKLLTFPYNYMLLSNNNGSSNILHYERFSGNTCNFTIKGVPTVGGSIKIIPTNYDSNLNSEEEGLIAGKLPTLNWSDDEYTNWLTQNSVNIALGVASAGITIVGGLGMMASGGGAVAGAGAVAAAIAIALKDSLANVAGGIFLLITKPFVTDDVISVSGDTGKIKEIKLVHTVVLTFDNKEIIIPNSVLMGSTVTNLSNAGKRRVDMVFSIGYNDDAKLAREIILKALTKHELALTDEVEPFARVTAHSASSVDITARVWALAGDYWTVYFDVLEEVREEFNKNGITIPFNQLDVHVDTVTK